jgi:endoglucanase
VQGDRIGERGTAQAREEADALRRRLLSEQLERYRRHAAGVAVWGSIRRDCPDVTQPIPKLVPRLDPLPMGRFDWVRTLAVNIALAQPLAPEYAELLGGRDDDDLLGLADSFAFGSCGVPETRDQLARS